MIYGGHLHWTHKSDYFLWNECIYFTGWSVHKILNYVCWHLYSRKDFIKISAALQFELTNFSAHKHFLFCFSNNWSCFLFLHHINCDISKILRLSLIFDCFCIKLITIIRTNIMCLTVSVYLCLHVFHSLCFLLPLFRFIFDLRYFCPSNVC